MGWKKLDREAKKELIKWLLRYALIVFITALIRGTFHVVAPRENLDGWFDQFVSILDGLWIGILMYMSITGWTNAQEAKEVHFLKAQNAQLRHEINTLMKHFW